MPVVPLCQFGSDRVDITQWDGGRARLRCFTCERGAWLDGSTVSEFDPGKLLATALLDQAREHRKRSPHEISAGALLTRRRRKGAAWRLICRAGRSRGA